MAKLFKILFISIFLVGCGNISEILSISPTLAAYDKSTRFTIEGKHLGETLTVKMDDELCSNLQMEDNGKKLNFDCKAPSSGSEATLTVKINNKEIKNGNIKIMLAEAFQKVDNTGNFLDKTSNNWACVIDNSNGLIWVSHSDISANFTYNNHTYQWSESEADTEKGNYNDCKQSLGGDVACNTANYISALNSSNLCGIDEWRLPSSTEIYSIFNCISPNYNVEFFPNSKGFYWLSSADEQEESKAHIAGFGGCSVVSVEKALSQYSIGVAKYDK